VLSQGFAQPVALTATGKHIKGTTQSDVSSPLAFAVLGGGVMQWKIWLDHCKELLMCNRKILPPRFEGEKNLPISGFKHPVQLVWA